MTKEELDKQLKDRSDYRELRLRIDAQAKSNFSKVDSPDHRIVSLGVKKMPMGYICVEFDDSTDEHERSYKEYFWIDAFGNMSEMFDDKWEAYYSARSLSPLWDIFTPNELRLIRQFDEILNAKVRFGRLKIRQ